MRRPALVLLCWIAPQAWAQAPACTPLQDDRILAQDLAAAIPAFHAIPPETMLGNTPPPGSQRIFHHPELLSLAQRYSVSLDVDAGACFERAMEPLDRNRLMEAMRAALQIPDARIELAETSLYLVPRGRIEFGLDRLGTPASPDQRAPVLWRGDVVYGEDHRFAIWARVRILAPSNEVVAAENLKPGRIIEPSQLRATTGEGFPIPSKQRLSMDQIVGMTPLRTIDVDTLQSGRRALDEGQLRRARLMGEAVLARNPAGAVARPSQCEIWKATNSSPRKWPGRAKRLY